MGEQGYTVGEMASHLDVLRDVLYDWVERYPEFHTALQAAQAKSKTWWETAGRNGLHAERFNAATWKFIMANRYRDEYAERRVSEVSGPGGGPIVTKVDTFDVTRLSDEERAQLKRTLQIALGDIPK